MIHASTPLPICRGTLFNRGAGAAFDLVTSFSRRLPERDSRVRWAARALPKSHERTFPSLGLPRLSDSICPDCTREIPALIFERAGQVLMTKTCPEHGAFEDIIYRDSQLFRRIEALYPGDDLPLEDLSLYQHGNFGVSNPTRRSTTSTSPTGATCTARSASRRHGHLGVVYEPSVEEIEKMLTDAANAWPKRQASVQFTGGEPTASPHLAHAIRFSKKLGFSKCQIATNGIRMAQSLEYRQEPGGRAHLHLPPVRRHPQRGLRRAPATSGTCSTSRCSASRTAARPASTWCSSRRWSTASTTIASARSSPSSRSRNIDVVITVSPARRHHWPHRGREAAQPALHPLDLAHDVRAQTPTASSRCATGTRFSATGPITDLVDTVNGAGGRVIAQVRLPSELRHRDDAPGQRADARGRAPPRVIDVDGMKDTYDDHGQRLRDQASQLALSIMRNYRSKGAPSDFGF
ncbi:MAG: hypothetical protein U0166_05695 [Acidobacteriota bacterium]